MHGSTRRLLLAGSWGPERIPARPDRDDADWFLPLHVRDERGARDRIAAQVAAGADVIVAPTWLTHRRALLPLGETRRVRAWTSAAVRVAREAVEIGLERREELLVEAPEDGVRRSRPMPLVAASLPALADVPETASGRLLPLEAATERDYRDAAGALADAEPDLLLTEGQATEAEARIAITEAADTGLPVWAALGVGALAEAGLEAWLDWTRGAGVERLLLPRLDDLQAAADGELPWGGLAGAADTIPAWLAAGAGVIARLDAAGPTALEPYRATIDDFERVEIEAVRDTERRWLAHLEQAAAIAPGGAAAWIGAAPDAPLPDGFEWLVVDPLEAGHLPAAHYRLVVAAADTHADLGRLLERGGVLVGRDARRSEHDLRVLIVDDTAAPTLVTYRRET